MIIVDPVKLGGVTCTRASPKWVYDRTGTLVEVPVNTLGVTYDASDLSKAPYALIEPESKNMLRYSEQFDVTSVWGGASIAVGVNEAVAPSGALTADRLVATAFNGAHYRDQEVAGEFSDGELYTYSVYLKADTLERVRLDMYYAVGSTGGYQAVFNLKSGLVESQAVDVRHAEIEVLPNGWCRCWIVGVVAFASAYPARLLSRIVLVQSSTTTSWSGTGDEAVFAFGAQLVPGEKPMSYIPTTAAAVTRAADVIGTGAGLVYSNVPMAEPSYDANATYAKDALVRDPVTHDVYKSLIDANKGKPLTDEASWNPRGKTNRWAMLDEYNNTQTSNPEEIVIVLSPEAICEGFYVGNVDADEIELVVVDQHEGRVYSEVTSLVTASGSSSYYDWCFRPADRADYFFTVSLPPYANALVTVVLRKPGGVAKCGMCAIGLVDEFGPSLYGLSVGGKDFSSTTFEFDGTSNTVFRDYAKTMNVDVRVNNGEIDYIQRRLFQLRQRLIIWIGGPVGATAVAGRYVSFEIVIPGLLKSDMSLQIEGGV